MSTNACRAPERERGDDVFAGDWGDGNTYVALGDESGDEVEVIIEVKAAAEFEGAAEAGYGGRLGGQLLHASDTAELFVGLVLRHGQPRCPAVPAPMVVMGHSGGGRWCGMLLVSVIVVVLRHVWVGVQSAPEKIVGRIVCRLTVSDANVCSFRMIALSVQYCVGESIRPSPESLIV